MSEGGTRGRKAGHSTQWDEDKMKEGDSKM